MSTAQQPIRLLVVDDHNLFRRGLVALLGQDARLLVVGEGQGWLWDVPTRELLCPRPDFAPQGWQALGK